ncbi:MAG TPA: hypothetical protein V6D47_01875 [Oscillatoriaceae cyanobacterium]
MAIRSVLGVSLLLATATIVGCSLPPVATPEQSFTVKYNQFVPNAVNGVPIPAVPAFPAQKVPASSIPVPAEAHSVKINSVTLDLKMQNTGPLPLALKIYMSAPNVDPYSQPPLGGDQGEIDLPAAGPEVDKSFSVDPTLFQQDDFQLGITIASSGTTQPITFQDSDEVTVKESASVSLKLF